MLVRKREFPHTSLVEGCLAVGVHQIGRHQAMEKVGSLCASTSPERGGTWARGDPRPQLGQSWLGLSERRCHVVSWTPGVALCLPTWIFDPIICAVMQIGEPYVNIEGLADLCLLLERHRLRRSFSDDSNVVQEDRHEEVIRPDLNAPARRASSASTGPARAEGDQGHRTKRGQHKVGAASNEAAGAITVENGND
ncbi:hypothetical protein ACVIRO_007182 [Rhizobium ruizarguesonis]